MVFSCKAIAACPGLGKTHPNYVSSPKRRGSCAFILHNLFPTVSRQQRCSLCALLPLHILRQVPSPWGEGKSTDERCESGATGCFSFLLSTCHGAFGEPEEALTWRKAVPGAASLVLGEWAPSSPLQGLHQEQLACPRRWFGSLQTLVPTGDASAQKELFSRGSALELCREETGGRRSCSSSPPLLQVPTAGPCLDPGLFGAEGGRWLKACAQRWDRLCHSLPLVPPELIQAITWCWSRAIPAGFGHSGQDMAPGLLHA